MVCNKETGQVLAIWDGGRKKGTSWKAMRATLEHSKCWATKPQQPGSVGSGFWINLWVKERVFLPPTKGSFITVGSILIAVPFVQKYILFKRVFKNLKVQKENVTQRKLYNLK